MRIILLKIEFSDVKKKFSLLTIKIFRFRYCNMTYKIEKDYEKNLYVYRIS